MTTFDLKSATLVESGLDLDTVLFGAAGGQGDAAPQPITLAAVKDFLDSFFLTPSDGGAVYQPLDGDLTAISGLSTASYGRSLLTLGDAADLAAEVESFFQPLDGDLTAIAALSTTTFGRAFLAYADEAAFKAAVNLEANTDFYAPGGTDVALADGGTGVSLSDPGADRVLFWDDSAGVVAWLTVGTGLTITDTTISASATSSGLILLDSGTISNAATLDIILTSYTSYRALKLVLSSFVPATDDVELWLRVSSNAGSSFDATGYSYVLITDHDSDTDAIDPARSAAANQILIAGYPFANLSVSNVAAEGGVDAEIDIHQQATSRWCRPRISSAWFTAAGASKTGIGTGSRETQQDTDALRILFENGDIASGNWALYGYA